MIEVAADTIREMCVGIFPLWSPNNLGKSMSKFFAAFALGLFALACWMPTLQAAQPREGRLFSQKSIEKGWQVAKRRQQPMLVMFTSNNCMYCEKMLAETYGHPAIERMLQASTQTVLAHADDYEGLVKKLGIRGYPSSVLVSPKGDVLDLVEGFLPPKEFAKRVGPLLKEHSRQARVERLSKGTAGR